MSGECDLCVNEAVYTCAVHETRLCKSHAKGHQALHQREPEPEAPPEPEKPAKASKPTGTEGVCRGCERNLLIRHRGLCAGCAGAARGAVKRGECTWEQLEAAGLCLPKMPRGCVPGPMLQKIRSLKTAATQP